MKPLLTSPETLTTQEVENFLSRGFIIIRGGMRRDLAEEWVQHSWERLGLDPNDPSTWERGESGLFLRLEPTRSAPMAVAAPRVYGAICDLCGGAERLDVATLSDTMIMNLGGNTTTEWASPSEVAQSGKGGWHKDGWHFKHFLDTPDQALLVTAIFSEVVPGAGGTFIAADSPSHVARFLAKHPEGIGGDAPAEGAPSIPSAEIISQCRDFVELTGDVGDVVCGLSPAIAFFRLPAPHGQRSDDVASCATGSDAPVHAPHHQHQSYRSAANHHQSGPDTSEAHAFRPPSCPFITCGGSDIEIAWHACLRVCAYYPAGVKFCATPFQRAG